MPVVDEQSYNQFMQVMTQQQAQVAEFAMGIRRLKQAEEETKARIQLERDRFALEQKKWTAESGLNKVRLEAATFELDAFKRKEGEAAKANEEVTAFHKELVAPLNDAMRTGDPSAIAAATMRVSRGLSTMTPAGQNLYWQGVKTAAEGRYANETHLAQIFKLMGEGRGAGAARAVTSKQALENTQAHIKSAQIAADGYVREDHWATMDREVKDLRDQQEPMKESMRLLFGGTEIAKEAALSNDLSDPTKLAQMRSVIQTTMGTVTGEANKRLQDLDSSLKQWGQNLALLDYKRRVTKASEDMVDAFIDEAVPALGESGATGEPTAGNTLGTQIRVRIQPYTEFLKEEVTSSEVATLRSPLTSVADRENALKSLRQRLLGRVPEAQKNAGLTEATLRAISIGARPITNVSPTQTGTNPLGAKDI